jgi:ribosomal protein L16/L10AE
MNLLTDELSMTAADLDTARTAIVRSLKRGVGPAW